MALADFKKSLTEKDLIETYNEYVLGSDVWFFAERKVGDHYKTYDAFKRYLSAKLGIAVNNIAVVGSAKLGFSLTPSKKYRPFGLRSDIDIVIVCPRTFRDSWDAFLDLRSKYHMPDYSNITSGIFRRFVTLKDPDTRNAFFDEWSRKVEPCKKDLQTIFQIPNEINYRIYESWDDVKAYHYFGLEQLRRKLRDSK